MARPARDHVPGQVDTPARYTYDQGSSGKYPLQQTPGQRVEGRESMSRGWWARIQMILALMMVLGASPLVTSAQVATPVPGTEPPVVEVETPVEEEAPVDSGAGAPDE